MKWYVLQVPNSTEAYSRMLSQVLWYLRASLTHCHFFPNTVWFLKFRLTRNLLPCLWKSTLPEKHFNKKKGKRKKSLFTVYWKMALCTSGSCGDYQHVASTLSLVTHASSSRTTKQLGHPCCPWARPRKSMAPSEMVRRQRNLARSSSCQPPPVLPSPASSWYQITLRWGNNIYSSNIYYC